MRSTASSSIIAAAEASRGTGLRPFPAVGGTLVEATRSQETEMRTGPSMLRKAAEPSAPHQL